MPKFTQGICSKAGRCEASLLKEERAHSHPAQAPAAPKNRQKAVTVLAQNPNAHLSGRHQADQPGQPGGKLRLARVRLGLVFLRVALARRLQPPAQAAQHLPHPALAHLLAHKRLRLSCRTKAPRRQPLKKAPPSPSRPSPRASRLHAHVAASLSPLPPPPCRRR